jgi:dodecin
MVAGLLDRLNFYKMEIIMSVARVTELSSTSNKSFQDAVEKGVKRASKTLRGVTGAWVKEHKVAVSDGKITSYQVNMMVTFVLED